jgi:hypothetical protein
MTGRRRFLALAATTGMMVGVASAHAWTWSFGSGKRVQGSGEVASESRDLSPFESIRVAGHFKVRVRQEGREGVTLQADRNLLPLIETQVTGTGSDRVLEIGIKPGYSLSGMRAPEVLVDVKTLRGFALAGSGDVRIDALRSERFDLALSGSGDVVLAGMQVARLGVRLSGSGDVTASGRAESLTIAVAGSGDVKAAELQADEVRVSVAGSGDAQVQALRHLKVSVAGSGDVRYKGTPQIESSIAGSGSVRRLGSS